MKKSLFWTFFLLWMSPLLVWGQGRHTWIPVETQQFNKISGSSFPHIAATTLQDTIYFSQVDSFKAFTGRFGQDAITGVFFTVDQNLFPIKIKQLVVRFYGGRTDTIGALSPATIRADLWVNATIPQEIDDNHKYTESFTQNISVPVEQIREQSFTFNDTSEIFNPISFAVGIQYTTAPDTIGAISPVFGYPPNKYNDFYVDSTGSDSSQTPVYYDHNSYWKNPGEVGNMSAYLIVSVDTSGTPTGITQEKWYLPDSRKIITNYPNPFNPQTVINIRSPYDGKGAITIYNVMGEKVFEQKKFIRKNEVYSFTWSPEAVATGTYFVSFRIKNSRFFHKMLYMK
jgi:hypothetical protein